MSAGAAFADAFDESKDNWKDEFAELYAALTPEEYAAARLYPQRPLHQPHRYPSYLRRGGEYGLPDGQYFGQNHAEIDTIPYLQKCRKSAVPGRFFYFRHCGGIGRIGGLCRADHIFSEVLCNDRKAIVIE